MTDRDSLSLIGDVDFEPVFIVGPHRSGTTLLHRLLAGTGCFNYVSAYHVIRYDEVLRDHLAGRTLAAKERLNEEFAAQGLKDRLIDSTPVNADSPIEYGFLLRSQRPILTERRFPLFEEICKKIQFVSQDATRPILLKNPWDALAFREIGERLPRARFVFIHRDPLWVMDSQVRAMREMLARRSAFAAMLAPWYAELFDHPARLLVWRLLVSERLGLWERVVGRNAVKAATYYLRNHAAVADRSVSIRYEDLIAEPQATLAKIGTFLHLAPGVFGAAQDRIAPRTLEVQAGLEKRFRAIAPQMAAYLQLYEYAVRR